MKLRSTAFKTFAICNMAAFAMFPAHAGSSEDAMEGALHQYHSASNNTEWQNIWMPQASANAIAVAPSGDLQMGEIVASYSRTALDKSGWENSFMSNSNYTAPNPLLAVGVGSGATSPVAEGTKAVEQFALKLGKFPQATIGWQ